jgi:transcriptional regulator with GAF, ATPase, and Fis domain
VPVNCAAISPNLVESELFGHEKGSFTGADRRVVGKFEYASGGTLFLDEIGDLSLEAQAKLLRALEDKKIRRVGGNEEIPVDLRVVCATNRDILALSKNGQFRRDLYFRINVFPIEPPPLRERAEDVPPLAQHFLNKFSSGKRKGITEEALKLLCRYTWPGNVRELANVMERGAILSKGEDAITGETLCFLRQEEFLSLTEKEQGDFRLPAGGICLEEVQKSLVRQALDTCGGNQSEAAKLLGLTRAKFRVLMKRDNGNGDNGSEDDES